MNECFSPGASAPKVKSKRAPWSSGPELVKLPVARMLLGPLRGFDGANPSSLVKVIAAEVPVFSVTYSLNAVGSMSQSITRRYCTTAIVSPETFSIVTLTW